MIKTRDYVGIFLFLSIIISVGSDFTSPQPPKAVAGAYGQLNESFTEKYKTTDVEQMNFAHFALSLLRNSDNGSESSSTVLSPAIVEILLGMLAVGANSDTLQEIKNAIMPLFGSNLHRLMGYLLTRLYTSLGTGIYTACKLYIRKGSLIRPEFSSIIKEFYRGNAEQIDFSRPVQAAQQMNSFIDFRTAGKTKKMIPETWSSELISLMTIGVIYCIPKWSESIKNSYVSAKYFYLENELIVDVDMVNLPNVEVPYFENGELQMVQIPLQGSYSLAVLLPRCIEGLKTLEEALDGYELLRLLEECKRKKIDIMIPKMKLENRQKLRNVLTAKFHISDAFSEENADFSNIAFLENFYVNGLLFRTFFEIEEQRLKADNERAAGEHRKIWGSPARTEFIANHPFLFMLVEQSTKHVVVIGHYTGP